MGTARFPGPDGLISFTRFSPKVNSAEIHVARPDGSGVQKLTSNPRHFSLNSDWSPNGQLIAFDSNRVDIEGHKRAVQVYLMNADGSGVTQLTRGRGFHGYAGLLPGRQPPRDRVGLGRLTRPCRESGSFPPPTPTASPKPRLSG